MIKNIKAYRRIRKVSNYIPGIYVDTLIASTIFVILSIVSPELHDYITTLSKGNTII